HLYIRAICVGTHDALLVRVNPHNFAQNHRGVSLLAQNGAYRRANLAGTEFRSCHLVKERLKQVMIGTVNQNDARGRVLQRLGSREAAESAADYDNYWKMVAHIYKESGRPGSVGFCDSNLGCLRSLQSICCGAGNPHLAGHQAYRNAAHDLRKTAFVPK